MNDRDNAEQRIRLAEAMNICHEYNPDKIVKGDYNVITKTTCAHCGEGPHRDFKPLTDANDDYAVLEWAWQQIESGEWTDEQWDTFKNYWREDLQDWNVWNYIPGRFARAALKVLDE